jgi:hypothetical protein
MRRGAKTAVSVVEARRERCEDGKGLRCDKAIGAPFWDSRNIVRTAHLRRFSRYPSSSSGAGRFSNDSLSKNAPILKRTIGARVSKLTYDRRRERNRSVVDLLSVKVDRCHVIALF